MNSFDPDEGRDAELRARLDRLGIIVVPRSPYEWGGYRYSGASDAIADAERAAR